MDYSSIINEIDIATEKAICLLNEKRKQMIENVNDMRNKKIKPIGLMNYEFDIPKSPSKILDYLDYSKIGVVFNVSENHLLNILKMINFENNDKYSLNFTNLYDERNNEYNDENIKYKIYTISFDCICALSLNFRKDFFLEVFAIQEKKLILMKHFLISTNCYDFMNFSYTKNYFCFIFKNSYEDKLQLYHFSNSNIYLVGEYKIDIFHFVYDIFLTESHIYLSYIYDVKYTLLMDFNFNTIRKFINFCNGNNILNVVDDKFIVNNCNSINIFNNEGIFEKNIYEYDKNIYGKFICDNDFNFLKIFLNKIIFFNYNKKIFFCKKFDKLTSNFIFYLSADKKNLFIVNNIEKYFFII